MSQDTSVPGQVEAVNHPESDRANKSDAANYDIEEQSSQTSTGQPKCSICQSTFRRPEHLKRHFRSHTKERPFECTQCGRHFSRTDTLHRHELSHHTVGSEGNKDRTHRITVKTFRACFKCAVARVRCSGGTPCGRCETRSLECQYPTERRSKAKTRGGDDSTLHNGTPNGSNAHSVSSFRIDGDTHPEQPMVQPQHEMTGIEFQFPSQHAHSNPSNGSIDYSINESYMHDSNGNEGRTPALPDASGMVNFTEQLPLPTYNDDIDLHRMYPQIPTSDIRDTLSPEHGRGLNHPGSALQKGRSRSITGIEMTATDPQPQMTFGEPLLDEAMLSTVNWLPGSLYLDAANGQNITSGLTSQPLHDTSNGSSRQTVCLPPTFKSVESGSVLLGNASQESAKNYSSASMNSPNKVGYNVSEAQSTSAIKRPADHYVDGAGARRPKYRRKRDSSSKAHAILENPLSYLQQTDDQPQFSFPKSIPEDSEVHPSLNLHIESPTYNKILKSFTQTCCMETFLYPKFESESFPSSRVLSSFLGSFFVVFQPVYPIFHFPTFNPNQCHWLVTLAMSAIGCQVSAIAERDKCSAALTEFVRRAVNVEREKFRTAKTPLWLLHAMMLNCIGLIYGGNEGARISALGNFGDLVNITSHDRSLCPSNGPTPISADKTIEQEWFLWIEDEVRRRTGYFIWLLDSSLAYHFDSRKYFTLEDGQASLPCHENLWQAASVGAWKQIVDESPEHESISLNDAVLAMYIEKRQASGIGEFSNMLLIHALYQRMWEVGDYFSRPLSFWNPTAKKQFRDTAIPSGSVWLPGIPSYSKWRNSACDCLDILHWTANSKIARAAGIEHPTVLHLHTARIVLLTPFREIRSLATSLAMEQIQWSDRQNAIEWHYIQRWIKHDQYKARLAIIHAGSTLWHIQRHSTDVFHEPVAVFLATLTLWAYGLCRSQAFSDYSPSDEPRHDQPSKPSFIHLDRPCDDELVQLFVREGQTMIGNMTGVGDICAPHGPEKVLRAGCEILADFTSWGISKRFIAVLTKLAGVMP